MHRTAPHGWRTWHEEPEGRFDFNGSPQARCFPHSRGIETFNATALDRKSSHQHALILAEQLGIAQTGSSDAHVVGAVGLCATGFEAHTARDLLKALGEKETLIYKQKEWNSTRILGSWVTSYVASTYTRIVNAV